MCYRLFNVMRRHLQYLRIFLHHHLSDRGCSGAASGSVRSARLAGPGRRISHRNTTAFRFAKNAHARLRVGIATPGPVAHAAPNSFTERADNLYIRKLVFFCDRGAAF